MRLGRYEILCDLASGGMGSVHVARHVGAAGFARLVAIKRLHPHLLKEPHFREMVRIEANLASQIHHPNVVSVVDVIEQETELCLVLEYVPSLSLSMLLRAAVKAGEKIPPAIVARIMIDVLAGLHAAHEVRDIEGNPLGLVHRDVSPQNVIVGVDGTARLIDFGIAKASSSQAITQSGELKGKLAYMSPEQLRRETLDRRSDLFSAGAMLYEALTGQRRFAGSDEGAVLLSIILGGSCDLTAKGFSADVDAVANKALAPREERFTSAREFQDALEQALSPASYREVAETLERLCGDKLAARAEKIRSAARADTPAPLEATPASLEATPASLEATPASLEATPDGPGPRPRARRVAVAVAAAAVFAIAALGARSYFLSPASPAQTAERAPPSAVAPVDRAEPPVVTTEPSIAIGVASSKPIPVASSPVVGRAARPRPTGELKKNPFR